jgi:hypothetical protein
MDRPKEEEDERESKPHFLGNYRVQSELKICGNSLTAPKAEAGCDSDPKPTTALGSLERAFVSVAQSIFAHVQNIESVVANYPPAHPVPRAVAKIQAQLNRLSAVYHSMGREMQDMANELDRFAAREEILRRDLDDVKTTNFKLTCAKKDLSEQVRDLKAAAAETEVEVRRLKQEAADAEAKYERLGSSHRDLQGEHARTAAEKLWLQGTIRKREAEVEKAVSETRRLQGLVQERDEEIERLRSNNLGLQSLVQQRGAEAEDARVDSMRLRDLIREKEAQLSSLAALPITPLSPLAPLGPFAFPAGPVLQTSQPENLLPPRPGSPVPFIKQEAPDSTTESAASPALPEPAEQLHLLGAGVADILCSLLHINRPVRYDEVLTGFLSNLGSAPDASSITVTQAPEPWYFQDPWTPDPPSPVQLHPALEAQLAHLCLLLPFPGTDRHPIAAATDNEDTNLTTFHLLTKLLTTLTKEDHSASPRAGLAFLQTLRSISIDCNTALLSPNTPSSQGQGNPSAAAATRAALLRLMLAELCRVLERTFPDVPKRLGEQQHGSLFSAELRGHSTTGGSSSAIVQATSHGPGYGAMTPVGCLAAALAEASGFASGLTSGLLGAGGEGQGQMVKEILTARCGSGFCSFSCGDGGRSVRGSSTESYRGMSRGDGGCDGGGAKEMGLLHCGERTNYFLMIDFGERSLRLVDCRLARWKAKSPETMEMDLIVARDAGVGRGEEELFRLEAAPKDVQAFWVRYAMPDV